MNDHKEDELMTSISIAASADYTFRPENEEWEAALDVALIQFYPGYYTCNIVECDRDTLHELELTQRLPDGTAGRCPGCNSPVDHKEDDVRRLEQTEYAASSICEVNSAIETNLLVLQRQIEDAHKETRATEERAEAERNGGHLTAADVSMPVEEREEFDRGLEATAEEERERADIEEEDELEAQDNE